MVKRRQLLFKSSSRWWRLRLVLYRFYLGHGHVLGRYLHGRFVILCASLVSLSFQSVGVLFFLLLLFSSTS